MTRYERICQLYSKSLELCGDFKQTYNAQEYYVEHAKSILNGLKYGEEFRTFTDVDGKTKFIHIFAWNENKSIKLHVAVF